MKLIIAGGRDYQPTVSDEDTVREVVAAWKVTEIVSGGASGADSFGERMAEQLGLPCRRFPADWATQGRSAGPRRNRRMVEYADAALIFPGGRGTASMAREAARAGLKVQIMGLDYHA